MFNMFNGGKPDPFSLYVANKEENERKNRQKLDRLAQTIAQDILNHRIPPEGTVALEEYGVEEELSHDQLEYLSDMIEYYCGD